MAKGVGIAGAAIGGVAVAAGGALFGLATKAGDAADRILDLNAITGMTTDSIQEWQQVAKVAGVDTETVTRASEKLTKTMYQLQQGTGAGTESLQKLGVSYDELNKLSPDQQMDTMIKKLSEIQDPAERARVGTDLFGKQWANLAPIVSMGAEGMDAAKQQAHDLGAVMDTDALNGANNFRIAMENVKTSLTAAGMKIGAEIAPVFTDVLVPAINAVVPIIVWLGQKAGEVFGVMLEWMAMLKAKVTEWVAKNSTDLTSFRDKISEVMKKAVEVMKSVWDFIVAYILPIFASLFSWVQGHMPVIKATISTVFNKIVEVARMVWAFFKDNILPIIARFYEYIQSKMPQIRSIVESVFKIIANVVKIAWGIFENLLLPVLKTLWNWIKPHLPKIQSIVEGAFNAVITIVEGVVKAFEKVTSAIKTAYDWLTSWNNKPASKKTVEVEERRTSSSGRLGGVQRYATGTNYAPGGLAMVGERGPELVRLPRGSKVSTANETKDMLRNQQVNNTYITVQGNIDSDLYDEIMSKQDQNLNLKLGFAGVKG